MDSKQLHGKIDMYSYADLFTFSHSFHRSLFDKLKMVEGGEYKRSKGHWLFSLSKHEIAVRKAIIQYKVKTEVIKHKAEDPGTEFNSNIKSETMPEKMPKADSKAMLEKPSTKSEMKSDGSSKKSGVLHSAERDLVEHFRKVMVIRNLSQRTIDSYISYIKKFLLYFRGKEYKEISNWEIQQYIHEINKEKGYAYQTLNTIISSIKSFYNIVYKIPITAIDMPRPKGEKRLPSFVKPSELEAMVASQTNLKHKTILILFFSTGIRKEELINLKISSIDLISNEIRIFGKGKKERMAYIRDSLHKYLESYMKAYDPKTYLFEGQKGGKYSVSSVGNVVKNAGRKAGINHTITPHILRHGFATTLITSGVGMPHVQKLLGHSSIKTTMIYTHLSDNNLRNLPDPLEGLNL